LRRALIAPNKLNVTRAHLSRILNSRAGVSAAMSRRRLAPHPSFKMHMHYDLWQAQKTKPPKIDRSLM
jgi:plasmid maintenance system antidote protein VapI